MSAFVSSSSYSFILRYSIDKQVITDARRIVGEPEDSSYIPSDPKEFCGRLFHTCYMGTENSTVETRKRAKELAEAIGRYRPLHARSIAAHAKPVSYHIDLNMDTVVTSVCDLFTFVTGARPRFRAHGGTATENLALQNIQVNTACITSDLRGVLTMLFLGPAAYGPFLRVCSASSLDQRQTRRTACVGQCQRRREVGCPYSHSPRNLTPRLTVCAGTSLSMTARQVGGTYIRQFATSNYSISGH